MADEKNITISGIEIEPGQSALINLNVAKLPTHTTLDLPVHVLRSKKPGPVLLLTAGLHGDEINGIEILRRMIRDKALLPEKGSVIVVPIVNIFGFLIHSRAMPDGKDLNRCFPGTKNGSLGSMVAYTMMKKILPDVTVGVDFHTGGAQIDNFPHVRCVFEKKENLQVAEYFNAPFIMNSKFIDKSFRKEAHRQKKNLIVFEGGESFRMDEVSIQEGINGISRLMHGLEMKEYKGAWNEMKYFKQTHWFRAPNSGLFSSIPNRGDYVSKGSPLAILSDPFGEVEKKVVSPYSGYILGINNKPVVNRGDALFNIGVER